MFISNNYFPNFINYTYIKIFFKKTRKMSKIHNFVKYDIKLIKKFLNNSLNYRFCTLNFESQFFYNKDYNFYIFSFLNNEIIQKNKFEKIFKPNNFSFGKNSKKNYNNIGLYQRYLCFLKTFF